MVGLMINTKRAIKQITTTLTSSTISLNRRISSSVIQGTILVPGVMDSVDAVTEKEKKTYENIDFDLETYKEEVGSAWG